MALVPSNTSCLKCPISVEHTGRPMAFITSKAGYINMNTPSKTPSPLSQVLQYTFDVSASVCMCNGKARHLASESPFSSPRIRRFARQNKSAVAASPPKPNFPASARSTFSDARPPWALMDWTKLWDANNSVSVTFPPAVVQTLQCTVDERVWATWYPNFFVKSPTTTKLHPVPSGNGFA